MHINFAEDLMTLSALRFCHVIGMLSTLFSLSRMMLVDVCDFSILALQNYYVYLLLDHYDEDLRHLLGKILKLSQEIGCNMTCGY